MNIDIVIPTYDSASVIEDTLDHLNKSIERSTIHVGNVINIDNESSDDTIELIKKKCNEYGWNKKIVVGSYNLPEARQKGISLVDTAWFLFLDDDVRISKEYIPKIGESISELSGAIQGKKASVNRENSEWVRRRARRGGTHATFIRTESVDNLHIPEDLVVLEDEYIRRYIESQGYLWIFNHQAVFRHDNMGRHLAKFNEGYLAGKYDLMTAHRIFLSIPKAILYLNNPKQQINRAIGWTLGNIISHIN
jgi:glycosyltransferase involved in cell wall biosynthesis